MSAPPKEKGRAWRWVLAVSLALNLLFIGAFAGAAFRHMRDPGDGQRGRSMQMGFGAPLARSLPRDARRELVRTLRSELSGIPSRPKRRQTYADVIEVLSEENFDGARLQAIFDRQGDVAAQVQRIAQEKWMSLVAAMPLEERQRVAERLEKAMKRSPKSR